MLNEIEPLRSLALDADRIFSPIVLALKWYLIFIIVSNGVTLYDPYNRYFRSHLNLLTMNSSICSSTVFYFLTLLLYIKSAIKANKIGNMIAKLVCEILTDKSASVDMTESAIINMEKPAVEGVEQPSSVLNEDAAGQFAPIDEYQTIPLGLLELIKIVNCRLDQGYFRLNSQSITGDVYHKVE